MQNKPFQSFLELRFYFYYLLLNYYNFYSCNIESGSKIICHRYYTYRISEKIIAHKKWKIIPKKRWQIPCYVRALKYKLKHAQ